MKSILSLVAVFIFISNNSYGYNEEATHPELSVKAVEASVLAKDQGKNNILKPLVGIDDIMGDIKGLALKDWIELGAELEDTGSLGDIAFSNARFNNHFHHPRRPWSEAGLSDVQTGESMILWSQDSSGQANAPEGDYSWEAIRNDYYGALIGTDESFRQEEFARVFRGLGHQMHLIQDAAQPDHTRNDAHPLDGKGLRIHVGYEKWTKDNPSFIRSLAEGVDPLFPSLTLDAAPVDGLVPITRLFDADLYSGDNPSASTAQGLAEYSNANFFSDDTIFAADRFPSDHKE